MNRIAVFFCHGEKVWAAVVDGKVKCRCGHVFKVVV